MLIALPRIARQFGASCKSAPRKLGYTGQTRMWIQVRTMDGRKSARVDNLSKLTTIDQLREKLVEEFQAEPERQRLFYRGKQVSTVQGLKVAVCNSEPVNVQNENVGFLLPFVRLVCE